MNTKSKNQTKDPSKEREKANKKLQTESVLEALKEQEVSQMSDEDLRAKITKLTSYINKMDMLLNRTEKMLAKELEDDPKEKKKLEEEVESKGVKIFIDPMAIMYIMGSEMDYKEERLQSGFVFNNPNAKNVCGCGESFSI